MWQQSSRVISVRSGSKDVQILSKSTIKLPVAMRKGNSNCNIEAGNERLEGGG